MILNQKFGSSWWKRVGTLKRPRKTSILNQKVAVTKDTEETRDGQLILVKPGRLNRGPGRPPFWANQVWIKQRPGIAIILVNHEARISNVFGEATNLEENAPDREATIINVLWKGHKTEVTIEGHSW